MWSCAGGAAEGVELRGRSAGGGEARRACRWDGRRVGGWGELHALRVISTTTTTTTTAYCYCYCYCYHHPHPYRRRRHHHHHYYYCYYDYYDYYDYYYCFYYCAPPAAGGDYLGRWRRQG